MSKITHAEVRMYRIGTGDCFVVKLFAGKKESFKMLIDAGSWSGKKEYITPFIEDLKAYVDNEVDVLVVTHEHKDHVYAFDACRELFTNDFKAGEIWMAWTENDKSKKVKEWKDKYGEQKMALARASQNLTKAIQNEDYRRQFKESRFGIQALEARENYIKVVKEFADLHLSVDNNNLYKGGLAGMDVVKNDIETTRIKYFSPGNIIEGVEGADGVKIYVLGPPKIYDDVSKEAGGKGESYDHNKILQKSGAFGAAVNNIDSDDIAKSSLTPFDEHYINDNIDQIQDNYKKENWRKIDYDWLYSAGSFALRMSGLTNNLSLALAIEFEESGRVMLFPGDAEYGSWASWHKIDWGHKGRDGKTPVVEDLLNRTVFYKVAHHLSHNGTAQKLGLEMMKHKDLAAMATLDYDIISDGWKNTMPNRGILKELLNRTKGRLMILKEDDLFFDFHKKEPLTEKIKEQRSNMTKKERSEFEKAMEATELYIQYTVKA
jgi:hypothetical protein